MLPAAYVWVPIALLLRALSSMRLVAPIAATHALTAGAMASLMMAMMMRSALGHTGRELRASPNDIVAYLLLQFAAAARVAATLVSPELYGSLVFVSGSVLALLRPGNSD